MESKDSHLSQVHSLKRKLKKKKNQKIKIKIIFLHYLINLWFIGLHTKKSIIKQYYMINDE